MKQASSYQGNDVDMTRQHNGIGIGAEPCAQQNNSEKRTITLRKLLHGDGIVLWRVQGDWCLGFEVLGLFNVTVV